MRWPPNVVNKTLLLVTPYSCGPANSPQFDRISNWTDKLLILRKCNLLGKTFKDKVVSEGGHSTQLLNPFEPIRLLLANSFNRILSF